MCVSRQRSEWAKGCVVIGLGCDDVGRIGMETEAPTEAGIATDAGTMTDAATMTASEAEA